MDTMLYQAHINFLCASVDMATVGAVSFRSRKCLLNVLTYSNTQYLYIETFRSLIVIARDIAGKVWSMCGRDIAGKMWSMCRMDYPICIGAKFHNFIFTKMQS